MQSRFLYFVLKKGEGGCLVRHIAKSPLHFILIPLTFSLNWDAVQTR